MTQTIAWLLWGGALGGLGYLAAVAIALSSGWAVPTAADFSCIGSAESLPLAVPPEWIETRWLLRSVLLLALPVSALAFAMVRMLAQGSTQALSPQRHWVLAGAGLQWLLLSLLDHHVFGLYALRAPSDTGHWFVHGFALLLLALAFWRRPSAAHQPRQRLAIGR